ncbi:hypothetical protein EV356DRAFT_501281 [Viridothelium virens]|uniref:Uncharacterized protein n=1 Tax=Viridothelium virens TaxID=1048519 RepID=A0A6A6HA59_VIRVR|nr:hypothetical protein EV356DRAFT_501281 [Viridothelium virens]
MDVWKTALGSKILLAPAPLSSLSDPMRHCELSGIHTSIVAKTNHVVQTLRRRQVSAICMADSTQAVKLNLPLQSKPVCTFVPIPKSTRYQVRSQCSL